MSNPHRFSSTNGSLVIRMELPTNAAPPQEHPEEWAQQEFERRLRSGAYGTGVCKDTGLVIVGVSLSYADSYSDLARQDSVVAMGRTVKNPRSADLKEMVAELGSEWDETAVQQAAGAGDLQRAWKSELDGENDKDLTYLGFQNAKQKIAGAAGDASTTRAGSASQASSGMGSSPEDSKKIVVKKEKFWDPVEAKGRVRTQGQSIIQTNISKACVAATLVSSHCQHMCRDRFNQFSRHSFQTEPVILFRSLSCIHSFNSRASPSVAHAQKGICCPVLSIHAYVVQFSSHAAK